MTKFELSYKKYNENAILIEWPSEISEAILIDINNYISTLEKSSELEIINIIQSYQAVLVQFKESSNLDSKISKLKSYYGPTSIHLDTVQKLWEVPVCYNTDLGLDLNELASQKEISEEKIIQLHTQNIYTVYFIGFLPGFMYLGGLDEKLHTPRKNTPRLKIPKGSVAIGGTQTGVYPQESPGGWNIIGQTPIDFFDPNKSKPCFISSGDHVKFKSISLEEFETLKTLVHKNAIKPEILLLDA